MTKMTEVRLSRHCSLIAKIAASWASDMITLPENYNRPANLHAVARFTDEMRARLDYIDEQAGRSGIAAPKSEGE